MIEPPPQTRKWKTPVPSKFAGTSGKWVDWVEDFDRWAHSVNMPEAEKVNQIGAWLIGDAKTAYRQFLDRTHLDDTPDYLELHSEFTKLFEEYLSPAAARGQLETLQWDMHRKTPEQFVARIRELCRVIYPSFSSFQQDQEAGARLMMRIPLDIKTLVRIRAGNTEDIVKLRTALIDVLRECTVNKLGISPILPESYDFPNKGINVTEIGGNPRPPRPNRAQSNGQWRNRGSYQSQNQN